jgi:Tol biopolymer transport system component
LPDSVPPQVRRLIVRCLTKDARQRLHDIADARLEIQEAIAARLQGEPTALPAVVPSPRRWGLMVLGAGLSMVAGLAAGVVLRPASEAVPQVTRATLEIGPAEELGTDSILGMLPGGSRTALAWSPDGRTLAFVGVNAGTRQIFLRDLNGEVARPLEGTQGTRALAYSPDGEWVAYWTDGELRKIRVAGGPPTKICAAADVNGITWGPTRIVYTTRTQVFEVAPAGGEPRALTRLGVRSASPFLLPDETAVLFTEYNKGWTSGDERVMVLPLTSGATPRVLVRGAADARYMATGRLAYLRQGTVFVVPFDAEALELQGDEVAVLSGVAQAVASWSGTDLTLSGQLAISPQGTLAYVASPRLAFPTSDLVAVDRRGQISPLGAPPNTYRERIETSPDGKRVAVSVQTIQGIRLFIYDRVRGTLDPAVAESAGQEAVRPIWSSDGRIALQLAVEGVSQFTVFRPDATTGSETVTASGNFAPSAWLPGGDLLIGTQARDLWTYAPGGTSEKWVQRTKTPAVERFPTWSPDGNWLAYVSNVSGRDEVYVEPYPGPGRAISVSNAGGGSPAWNPKGGELFYTEPRTGEANEWRLMSAAMTDPRAPGRPMPLFSFSAANLLLAQCSPTTCYSVAPDGQSFFTLRVRPGQPPKVTSVQLIVNWYEEVKRLAPTR